MPVLRRPRSTQKRLHQRASNPRPAPKKNIQPPGNPVGFQQLVENIPVITYVAVVENSERKFLYLSPQLQTLLGYSVADWQAQPNLAWQSVYEPDRSKLLAAFQYSWQTGQPFNWVYRYQTRDQRLVWVRDEAVVTLDAQGAPQAMQGIMRDVTEYRAIQEAVAQSEARFRILSELAFEGVVIHRHGVILEVNQAAVTLLERPYEELMGLNLVEQAPPAARPTIEKMLGIGYEGVYEATGVRRDGSPINLEVSGRDVMYQGEPARVAIIRDRTDYKRDQMALGRQTSEFAVLYALAGELAAQHDLNAVLDTVVKQAARLIGSGGSSVFLYDAARVTLTCEAAVRDTGLIGTTIRLGDGAAGMAAQTRQPFAVPDYANWEGRSRLHQTLSVTSALQVPMLFGGELIGTLGVVEHNRPSRVYTQDEIRLLTLLAGQAAAAVHNARLLEITRYQLSEFAALHAITNELAAQHDLKSLLNTIVKRAVEVTHSGGGSVFLYDTAKGVLTLEAVPNDQSLLGTQMRLGEGAAGIVAQTRQPLVIPDYVAWEGRSRQQHLISNVTSVLQIPMLFGGELIGTLGVVEYDHPPRHYTTDEIHLLTLIAGPAAAAVHNARLLEEARQRLSEFAVLYEVTNDLATQHDFKSLLSIIAQRAAELTHSRGGAIFLYDATRETLTCEAVVEDIGLLGLTTPIGVGAAGIAAQTRAPLAVPDYAHWPGRNPLPRINTISSVLQVPMLLGGELIGTLGVAERDRPPRYYTENEIRLLTLLAGPAAAAVRNARLLESTRRRLSELEALNHISRAMRTATTVAELLPRLLDETLTILGTDTGLITLVDDEQAEFYDSVARGWFLQLVDGNRLPLTTGLSGYVYQRQQPYLVVDYASDEHVRAEARSQMPPGWSGGGVPIKAGEAMVGLLFVALPAPRQLQPSEMHLLNAIAETAGNAIQRMRLYAQVELRSQRLSVLRAIDLAITSETDLPTTLNLVLDEVTTQLRLDAACILLLDAHKQTLIYSAGKGFRTDVLQKITAPMGQGRAGQAALERRLLYTDDLANENSEFAWLIQEMGEGFLTHYAAPLISKGQVRGVLEVFHRSPYRADVEWLDFLEALATQAAIAIDNAELFDGLQRSNFELSRAYEQTLEGWSRALDLRDRETEGHTQRVTEVALRLAEYLGLKGEELAHIRWGALLHDIGKMGIPDHILLKPGPLTDEEWKIMRLHPGYAYQMLAPINYLHRALDIPYCHHERWDGSGYPRKLKAYEIPLSARIFAVVDVWDALRSNRPYRTGWSQDRIFNYLRSQAGSHFDPMVVEAFLLLFQNNPPV